MNKEGDNEFLQNPEKAETDKGNNLISEYCGETEVQMESGSQNFIGTKSNEDDVCIYSNAEDIKMSTKEDNECLQNFGNAESNEVKNLNLENNSGTESDSRNDKQTESEVIKITDPGPKDSNPNFICTKIIEDDCIYSIAEIDIKGNISEEQHDKTNSSPVNPLDNEKQIHHDAEPEKNRDKKPQQNVNAYSMQAATTPEGCNETENTLFIGNLVSKIKRDDVMEYFSKYGNILRFELIENGKFKKRIKFGYLTFESRDSYDNVLKTMPHIVKEKELKINPATPRLTHNKIMVYDIKNISKNKIINYFKKYGNVTNFEMPEKFKKRSFCFISFDTDEGVKAVLKQTHHIIDFKTCEVTRASRARFRFKTKVNFQPSDKKPATDSKVSLPTQEKPKMSNRKLKWLNRKAKMANKQKSKPSLEASSASSSAYSSNTNFGSPNYEPLNKQKSKPSFEASSASSFAYGSNTNFGRPNYEPDYPPYDRQCNSFTSQPLPRGHFRQDMMRRPQSQFGPRWNFPY